MAGGTVDGVVGRIVWGRFAAASINGYTVTRSADNKWSLRATVVLSNPFNLKQRPLLFVAPHAKGEWRWPIDSIELGPNHVVATLGAPIE